RRGHGAPGRRGALHAGRRGRCVRRLGDLQVRRPGPAREGDRRGDDALRGSRDPRARVAGARRADGRDLCQLARSGPAPRDPRLGKEQYHTAAQLHGLVAGPGESLEWLFSREQDRSGPLNYDVFYAQVGAVAMGATTYEWILEHGERWPYELPSWVFTHRRLERASEHIRFTSGDVAAVHDEMVEAAGERNRWIVGGGGPPGQVAAAGLLGGGVGSIPPLRLGAGAPLLPRRVELRLEELERNVDFACARYAVVR